MSETSRRRTWLTVIPVATVAVLIALFVLRLFSGDPSRLPSALVGREAPDFSLPPLVGIIGPAGGPLPGLARTDLAGGRVSVINVWASWCVPCRDEHPYLLRLAERDDIELFGINYKDKPDNARRFLGALGNPYRRIGVDENGRAAIEWGVYGVPETYIVDRRGIVTYRHIGPLTAESLENTLLPEIRKARDARN